MTQIIKNVIKIYADGACSGNPGAGGWGCVLIYGENIKKLSGGESDTTNNKMELKAVISGLEAIKNNEIPIEIYTDSKYVQQGITEWIFSWKKNGWKTASKQPVKNADLWEILDKLNQKFQPSWHWVKGHSGDKYNEIADDLARNAIKK